MKTPSQPVAVAGPSAWLQLLCALRALCFGTLRYLLARRHWSANDAQRRATRVLADALVGLGGA